jgi:hypothetical protein
VLELEVQQSGYLSVVAIGQDGKLVVLLPNKHVSEPEVEPGPYRIPNSDWPKDVVLQATSPGATSLFAFVAKKPLGLFASADGERDAYGRLKQVFGTLSQAGTRAIGLFVFHAGEITLDVCEQGDDCR